MATAKAKLVSTRELGAALDQTVALVAARHNLAVDKENVSSTGN